ncbi:hypothetical protein T492DRAFT_98770 [Pavlovales sp. CCMP2436]|nr:hypothetical protein T492DRAFT_98770 [Pavlovales sp. CCMP2436]
MGRKRARSQAMNGMSQTTSYVGSANIPAESDRPPSPTGSSRPARPAMSNAVSQREAASATQKPRPAPTNSHGAAGQGQLGMGQHMSQLAAAMCNPFCSNLPYSNMLLGPNAYAHPGALMGADGHDGDGGLRASLAQAGGDAGASISRMLCDGRGGRDAQGVPMHGAAAGGLEQVGQQPHSQGQGAQQRQQQHDAQQQGLFAAQMAQMAQMAHFAHLQQQQAAQQAGRGGGAAAQLWPGLLPPPGLFGGRNWQQAIGGGGGDPSGGGLGNESSEQRDARDARDGARDGALAVQALAAQRAGMPRSWPSAADLETLFGSATPPQPQPLSCGMTMAGAGCKLEDAGMPLAKAAELNDYELDDNAGS